MSFTDFQALSLHLHVYNEYAADKYLRQMLHVTQCWGLHVTMNYNYNVLSVSVLPHSISSFRRVSVVTTVV